MFKPFRVSLAWRMISKVRKVKGKLKNFFLVYCIFLFLDICKSKRKIRKNLRNLRPVTRGGGGALGHAGFAILHTGLLVPLLKDVTQWGHKINKSFLLGKIFSRSPKLKAGHGPEITVKLSNTQQTSEFHAL